MANTEVDAAVYKTLLESTKAIPWKIDWSTMRFEYIGPQIEAVLGWTPESWVTVQDWADRIHPDDRQRVVDFCVAQSKAGVDHEADYRALTKDGQYVWLRDVVHVVRSEDGAVEALVGFMFDVSERKKTEEKLLVLQRELHCAARPGGVRPGRSPAARAGPGRAAPTPASHPRSKASWRPVFMPVRRAGSSGARRRRPGSRARPGSARRAGPRS